MGAQLCITDVAEVIHLASGADATLFHLHKVADSAVIADIGIGAQMGIGPNCNSITYSRVAHDGEHHGDITAKGGVLEHRPRADTATIADAAAAPQMGLRLNHHITANPAVLAQGAAAGIDKGHTLTHPVIAQPFLQNRFALGQLFAVVDAVHLIGISHLHMSGGVEHGHRVGEIKLPLVVVGAQLWQHGRELLPVEAVDPGVREVIGALLVVAITVFHDGADAAIGIGEHPPIAGGIVESGGQQGDIGAARSVGLDEFINGFRPQ